MTTDRGVIYAAGREPRFLCEAIASARTLRKRQPRIPIALFTDIPPLFDKRIPPFDTIIPIEPELTGIPNEWVQGLLVKVKALARSPYRKTLFLDTDTRVLGDIAPVFDLLDACAIAAVPCSPETSMSCREYGPMFNSGVIAYRDEKKIRRLMKRWEENQRANMKLAGTVPLVDVPWIAHVADEDKRRYLLATDQLSLAQLLSPVRNELGLELRILDDTWNLRTDALGDATDIRIHHADCYKVHPREVERILRSEGIIG
jgi:hypothetical protein